MSRDEWTGESSLRMGAYVGARARARRVASLKAVLTPGPDTFINVVLCHKVQSCGPPKESDDWCVVVSPAMARSLLKGAVCKWRAREDRKTCAAECRVLAYAGPGLPKAQMRSGGLDIATSPRPLHSGTGSGGTVTMMDRCRRFVCCFTAGRIVGFSDNVDWQVLARSSSLLRPACSCIRSDTLLKFSAGLRDVLRKPSLPGPSTQLLRETFNRDGNLTAAVDYYLVTGKMFTCRAVL